MCDPDLIRLTIRTTPRKRQAEEKSVQYPKQTISINREEPWQIFAFCAQNTFAPDLSETLKVRPGRPNSVTQELKNQSSK
jgi:hypothetical protein